jgi:hypothetical protein
MSTNDLVFGGLHDALCGLCVGRSGQPWQSGTQKGRRRHRLSWQPLGPSTRCFPLHSTIGRDRRCTSAQFSAYAVDVSVAFSACACFSADQSLACFAAVMRTSTIVSFLSRISRSVILLSRCINLSGSNIDCSCSCWYSVRSACRTPLAWGA